MLLQRFVCVSFSKLCRGVELKDQELISFSGNEVTCSCRGFVRYASAS